MLRIRGLSLCHNMSRCLSSTILVDSLSDKEIVAKILRKELSVHKLESLLSDPIRAMMVRRQVVFSEEDQYKCDNIPSNAWDSTQFFSRVAGHNCESTIGYIPIPVGIVGPIKVNSKMYHIPMATTEGALIASTNRGARAISMSGGTVAVVVDDGMTRAPVFKCTSVLQANEIKQFLETEEGFSLVYDAFSQTTKHGKMKSIKCFVSGNRLHVRVKVHAGDAMGMNMLTKGSQHVADSLCSRYPSLQLESLSGNLCTDKKSSAINWILGRGKSVTCEVHVPNTILRSILKCEVKDIISLNTVKNLVGSSLAASLGGSNAHAANIVAAVFLATGQDIAQVVDSSQCLDFMEEEEYKGVYGLYMSVTMPTIEVGTIGGGTGLAPQHACIDMMGEKGEMNAALLSQLVASTVMAGELSLMAAQVSGHLVSAHEKLGHIL